jgi:hypothetical protein
VFLNQAPLVTAELKGTRRRRNWPGGKAELQRNCGEANFFNSSREEGWAVLIAELMPPPAVLESFPCLCRLPAASSSTQRRALCWKHPNPRPCV